MGKPTFYSHPVVYDRIRFASTTERDVYKKLKSLGFNPIYEPATIVVWEGREKTTVPFYNSPTSNLKCQRTISCVQYTPDFVVEMFGKTVFIEVKGVENEGFPYRRKLFRDWLESHGNPKNTFYFEIRNLTQCQQMLEILEFGKILTKVTKRKKKEKPNGKKKTK